MKNADSAGSDSYFIRLPAAPSNRKDIEQEMPGNASIVSTPSRKKPGGRARKSKAVAVLERSPVLGWRTSDEDEIGLRRWRGSTEIQDVVALNPDRGFFGEFRVRSASQSGYDVEIRSLEGTQIPAAASTTESTRSEHASMSKGFWQRSGAEKRGRFAQRLRPEARE